MSRACVSKLAVCAVLFSCTALLERSSGTPGHSLPALRQSLRLKAPLLISEPQDSNASKNVDFRKKRSPVETRRCQEKFCNVTASFGFVREGKRMACGRHRQAGMVNLKAKPCAFPEGCTLRPRYGPAGGHPTFCLKHRRPGNIPFSRTCSWVADQVQWRRKCALSAVCDKTASFGLPSDGHPSACAQHRGPGFVDLRSKRCKSEGCFRAAGYGDQGSLEREFCRTHRKAGQVGTVHRCCEKCGKRASLCGGNCTIFASGRNGTDAVANASVANALDANSSLCTKLLATGEN